MSSLRSLQSPLRHFVRSVRHANGASAVGTGVASQLVFFVFRGPTTRATFEVIAHE